MTRYTAQELRAHSGVATTFIAAQRMRAETKTSALTSYDVFLSHSVPDASVVLGLKRLLEAQGLSVYVDWDVDPELDRAHVSATTAARLQSRMNTSRSLVYATSRSASRSRWMPWELGYFDGKKSGDQIAICPIEPDTTSTAPFVGEEYLGLYKQFEAITWNGTRVLGSLVTPDRKRAQFATSFARSTGLYTPLDS